VFDPQGGVHPIHPLAAADPVAPRERRRSRLKPEAGARRLDLDLRKENDRARDDPGEG
jgi:hypothetical protein